MQNDVQSLLASLKRLLASSNIAYLQALQSISIALQSARAHSITIVREFLTLDGPPTLPDTAGPLKQLPPLSLPARLLVPRFYVLNPPPASCTLYWYSLDLKSQCESWTNSVSSKGPSIVFLGCQSSRATAGHIEIFLHITHGLTIC